MKAVASLAAVLRFACGGANIPPPFEHDAVQLALDEEAADPDSSASSVPARRPGVFFLGRCRPRQIQRARRRRFIRALEAAKAELASIPAEHRFRLAREFDEAADMARRHVEYQRPS